MADGLGVGDRLHDHVALDEIELYAEVLIAVADADRPLGPAELDRVLGLPPRPPASAPEGSPERDTGADADGAPDEDPGSADEETPPRRTPPGKGTGVRFAGPVPPARDGHRPSPVALPVHGAVPDGARASHPLCGPFLPRFVPWRAWHF